MVTATVVLPASNFVDGKPGVKSRRGETLCVMKASGQLAEGRYQTM
jgi:hypothetical protein